MKKAALKSRLWPIMILCLALAPEPTMALKLSGSHTGTIREDVEPIEGGDLNTSPRMVFPSHMEAYFYSALFDAGESCTVMFLVANAWGQVIWSKWSNIEGVSLPDYDLVNLCAKKQLSAGDYMFTVGIFSAKHGVSFAPQWYRFRVQY